MDSPSSPLKWAEQRSVTPVTSGTAWERTDSASPGHDGGTEAPTAADGGATASPPSAAAPKNLYKVAIVSWESLAGVRLGSVAAQMSGLAAALAARGHEVHVYTSAGEPTRAGHELIDGVHYHRVSAYDHPSMTVAVTYMCDGFRAALDDTEAYMNARFDVIHCYDWLSVPALRHFKQTMNRRCVFHCCSIEAGRSGGDVARIAPLLSQHIAALEQDGAGLSDRVIACSNALREQLCRHYTFDWDKLRTVPYALERPPPPPPAPAEKLAQSTVLYVGALGQQQGVFGLLEAFRKVRAEHAEARLVFVGDGPSRHALLRRAREEFCIDDDEEEGNDNGAAKQRCVTYAGVCTGEELRGWYRSASVCVVPGASASGSMACLEAWAAATPTVACAQAGLNDVITHQHDGLLVGADAAGLAWGLEYCLSDAKRAADMGRRGADTLRQRHNWGAVAAAVNAVYDELVGDAPAHTQG